MSPAARKVSRLKNLRVEEVSSVTRGAAYGARVLIRKREEGNNMHTQSRGSGALSFAKSVIDRANDGQLSQFALNTAMQEIARFYFDGDMNQMLSSAVGKLFLAPRTARTSAFEEAELQKAEGYHSDPRERDDGSSGGMDHPGHNNRRRRRRTGANANADTETTEDDKVHSHVGTKEASFSQKVASLMKSERLSFDAACTAVLRKG
jgi:hypothetical protein